MAGLLDDFSEFIKTPGGQGLLAATFGGLAGAQRGAPLNSLGRAGLAGLSGYGGALDRQTQQAEAAQMGKYRDMQMATAQAQIDAARARAAAEAKKQAALANPWTTPVSEGTISVPESGGVEMFSQGVKVGAPSVQGKPVLNVPNLLTNGVTPEEIQKLDALRNLGMDEVARTQDVEGPNGQKTIRSFDKFGRPVGSDQSGYVAPVQVNQGDRTTFIKPTAGVSLPTNMSWADKNAAGNLAISRERLNFDKAGGAESVKASRPEWKDGQWVVPPKDMKPGETRAVTPQINTKDARDALTIIGEAEKYIDAATGSGVGTGLDWVGRALGYSTKGDTAIGQLKALEGLLVSKMPKMSGPQSDKDVALYKQMAAEIGDPMIPNSRKKAALQVVKNLQTQYAKGGSGGASGGWDGGGFRILSVE